MKAKITWPSSHTDRISVHTQHLHFLLNLDFFTLSNIFLVASCFSLLYFHPSFSSWPNFQGTSNPYFWCDLSLQRTKQNIQNAYPVGIQILQGLSFCFPSVRGSSCISGWIPSIPAICILVLDSLSRHFSCLWWSLENFAFSSVSHSDIHPVRKRKHAFWEVKWALAYTQKQSLTVTGKHKRHNGTQTCVTPDKTHTQVRTRSHAKLPHNRKHTDAHASLSYGPVSSRIRIRDLGTRSLWVLLYKYLPRCPQTHETSPVANLRPTQADPPSSLPPLPPTKDVQNTPRNPPGR